MDFSEALEYMKAGNFVARICWNKNREYIYLLDSDIDENKPSVEIIENIIGDYIDKFCIVMKRSDGSIVPWYASQADLLADDWEVVII